MDSSIIEFVAFYIDFDYKNRGNFYIFKEVRLTTKPFLCG